MYIKMSGYFSQIYYRKINDEYSYGHFIGINIIIRHEDGYVNASKLCKDYNKQFGHWKRLKQSQELMEYYQKILGVEPIKTVNGARGVAGVISGTYVNPNLLTDIASWISKKLGDRVSQIVNEYAAKNWQELPEGVRDDKIKMAEYDVAEIKKLKLEADDMKNKKDDKPKLTRLQKLALTEKNKAEKAVGVIDKYATKIRYSSKVELEHHLLEVLKMEVDEEIFGVNHDEPNKDLTMSDSDSSDDEFNKDLTMTDSDEII